MSKKAKHSTESGGAPRLRTLLRVPQLEATKLATWFLFVHGAKLTWALVHVLKGHPGIPDPWKPIQRQGIGVHCTAITERRQRVTA